jgi:hypothetical protein
MISGRAQSLLAEAELRYDQLKVAFEEQHRTLTALALSFRQVSRDHAITLAENVALRAKLAKFERDALRVAEVDHHIQNFGPRAPVGRVRNR